MDAAILHQKELKNIMLDLTDEEMCTTGIYLKQTKEKILFLYHNLNLSQMNFLKVLCVFQLVDEEAVASLG